jgi:hypothetical protein
VVFTAITGDFEFGTKTDYDAGLFRFVDGVFDLLKIGIEFHSPLVKIASSYLQEPHRDYECEFVSLFVEVKIARGSLIYYSTVWYGMVYDML